MTKLDNLMYQSLFEKNPDAIYAVDGNGVITMANDSCERIIGYPKEELIGHNFLEFLPPHEVKDDLERFQKVLKGAQSEAELSIVHRTGQIIYIHVMSLPIYEQENKIIGAIGIAKDITRSKQLENELQTARESHLQTAKMLQGKEAKLKLIADNTSDIIFLMDEKGDVTFISSSFTRILGYSMDEFLHDHCLYGKLAQETIHPDDIDQVKMKHEWGMRTKEFFHVDYRVRHKEGHWVHIETHVRPILDEDNLVGLVMIARDITERKRNEELLRISDKLSVLGELAAGIAHEIRNPLTSIKGFIQLFQSSNLEKHEYYPIILDELDRINFIVSELLILAKPQLSNYRIKNLNEILSNTVTLLSPQALLQGVDIITEFDEEAHVICEENHLKQVFINLIKNSMEAIEQEGHITIRTRKLAGGLIQIECVDSGCGIPQELVPKLGEPFYTTKAKGTGLGLMVSLKIIKDHHGNLHIESSQNQGTSVTITLPMVETDSKPGI
ncbi:PAS domain-containing sensor histidine kinase [Brevibacillus ginsengisoli]|uniref:PAS domain-containing sensor histidine kinase n=1 Tax=Brevibacillus ginsengisoli TaxID=363854 RepID=UPI003CF3DC7B